MQSAGVVADRRNRFTGVWTQDDEGKWHRLNALGYVDETDLHDLIEGTPSMLPLAGSPNLAMIGREVRCGREFADLLAVEADTGRPVIVEVKLAANTDRRQALTQILGYAAYLRRLDYDGLTTVARAYLARHDLESVESAAIAAAEGDPSFDLILFRTRLDEALYEGLVRAVIVLDTAPPELVERVGYLQEMTSDRLTLDIVVVTAYDLRGRRVVVPQLVEPDRSQRTATLAGTGLLADTAEVTVGAQESINSIEVASLEHQGALHQLTDWALGLEREGLAKLSTSKGKARWVLRAHLPEQQRSLVVI